MGSSVIRASLNGGVERAASETVTVYERGRVCAHPGCSTRLSVYNPSTYCAAHAPLVTPSRRPHQRRGPVTERPCANEDCDVIFMSANPKRLYCSQRCRMAAFQRRRAKAALVAQEAETSQAAGTPLAPHPASVFDDGEEQSSPQRKAA